MADLYYRATVSGVALVARRLRALAAEFSHFRTLDRIADEGAQAASRYAPKKSGRLARNIRGRAREGKAWIEAAEPYAGPINYGWGARNIEPTHFMQKADEEIRPRAAQLLEDEISQSIRKRGLS